MPTAAKPKAKPKAKPLPIPLAAVTPAKPAAAKKSKSKSSAVQSSVKSPAKKASSAKSVSAKPVGKTAANVPGTTAQSRAAKPAGPKKPKLVRDSFTIPKVEYAVLDHLKQRADRLASPAKKSELLRAGIKALAAMSNAAFVAALGVVPAIKTGRPSKA